MVRMNYKDNRVFEKQVFSGRMEQTELTRCTFRNCRIEELTLLNCALYECSFENCVIRNISCKNSAVRNAVFDDCLLMAVNPAEVMVKGSRAFPADELRRCTLRYINFIDYDLIRMDLSVCTFDDCLFAGCGLRESNFSNAKFRRTAFSGCDLQKADFRGAQDYDVDITSCKMKGAKFSYPDAICLLSVLGIEID